LQSLLGKHVAAIVFDIRAYMSGKCVAAPAGAKIDDNLNLTLSIREEK
jgi:hypothetical protein